MHEVTEHRIRHLPVLEREGVVGIISIGDLANRIITPREDPIGHLTKLHHGYSSLLYRKCLY